MNNLLEDKKLIVGFIGASVISWNVIRKLKEIIKNKFVSKSSLSEWIPVGRIGSLHIYPIKSCRGLDVFQYRCTPIGPVNDDYIDRSFLVINGETGQFYTARTKPEMVLIEVKIKNGAVTLTNTSNKNEASFNIDSVRSTRKIQKAYLHGKLRQDGLDCGDEAAQFFSNAINEPNTRLIMYDEELYTDRTCKTEQDWWNNPVPARIDEASFSDLAPFMITTEASLQDLNTRLENDDAVTSTNFRPNIVVNDCQAYDEDKWQDLRIGDVELECFKPCTRCILTTVHPNEGTKNKNMQPLRKLREYRLAPEGKLRDAFKDSPIFGVNAGVVKGGHIHVGQVVWARYKPSEF